MYLGPLMISFSFTCILDPLMISTKFAQFHFSKITKKVFASLIQSHLFSDSSQTGCTIVLQSTVQVVRLMSFKYCFRGPLYSINSKNLPFLHFLANIKIALQCLALYVFCNESTQTKFERNKMSNQCCLLALRTINICICTWYNNVLLQSR